MKRNIVALTGLIGSGKSAVAEILREMGFETLDCDKIARQVEKMPTVLSEITRLLGEGYVVDGQLVRDKIRERIFADENLHRQYSALFWGKIAEELTRQVNNAPETVFVEIAVIDAFEFDWTEIWQVESAEQNIIDRVRARDNVSPESVKNVVARQKRAQKPTRIIMNNGSLEELRSAVMLAAQPFLHKRLT